MNSVLVSRERLLKLVDECVGNADCVRCKDNWPALQRHCRERGVCLSLVLSHVEKDLLKESICEN